MGQMLCDTWDHSSLTRDTACALCIARWVLKLPDRQGILNTMVLIIISCLWTSGHFHFGLFSTAWGRLLIIHGNGNQAVAQEQIDSDSSSSDLLQPPSRTRECGCGGLSCLSFLYYEHVTRQLWGRRASQGLHTACLLEEPRAPVPRG